MQKRMNVVALDLRNPFKKKNVKIINRLLRAGYTLRLAPSNEASRFDRR